MQRLQKRLKEWAKGGKTHNQVKAQTPKGAGPKE